MPEKDITVIVNVGDNIKLFGLYICPDIDTIMYMFAGLLNRGRGWGITGDSFRLLKTLHRYGLETWFNIGDRDLATHIYRTAKMEKGSKLSEVTKNLSKILGVKAKILPVTDDWVETKVNTDKGLMHFQEFWVRRKARDRVLGLMFDGVDRSEPAPGVLKAIERSGNVLISPANPITSIEPILSVPGVRKALKKAKSKVLAFSPIIGKKPFSGPAGKLMGDLGLKVSSYVVAMLYKEFISKFVIDVEDVALKSKIEGLGVGCVPTRTRMNNLKEERKLAEYVLKHLP